MNTLIASIAEANRLIAKGWRRPAAIAKTSVANVANWYPVEDSVTLGALVVAYVRTAFNSSSTK
ncbi:MAG: hypothetical protein A3H57_03640 [Candidatus Taylorbacteria bacterium RIFCSPLOWO2_02_FULL_43_11]|uniref:Uncharacterized protein n=1 Tax=Candidatus Taylorbacteria bacterium RIFCSPHIGHO2_02_FULL_43_32b TaxID=1802306 RepID=A0A1G2MP95_9BACT|nr:MAG: hypothetical protein A2743_04580 [Candidatus Taylorbacteria bacterium RIFCSPHIGHO2_01_FULL_43_47]OHA24812.1 MAG: hypothetical protein A3C72_03205 [Candidatus Taylorbacteria bacterium RIFCSPHIGHO2_02_FULL_43_32b]OHA31853.1 MAG: hypothetical protein A3B08_01080 [Candidatus Taylorbacteria bacterium RIFCSPLOWO2_01_FULL_43_44]OHA35646.1 MAG: hypothetical protein A3H57_03640 [Candidatus Taylorbacteria bacterium RIFCSPLOWO2_02_FULL_43_11]